MNTDKRQCNSCQKHMLLNAFYEGMKTCKRCKNQRERNLRKFDEPITQEVLVKLKGDLVEYWVDGEKMYTSPNGALDVATRMAMVLALDGGPEMIAASRRVTLGKGWK